MTQQKRDDTSITERGHLLTEQNNPESENLDQLSTVDMVDVFCREDEKVIKAMAIARDELADAVECIATALSAGGRLFYVGAGTSGRLGVLDASECPPTFCTPPELVQGIIAGGEASLVRSSEGLEDLPDDGAAAIAQRQVTQLDVVVGITAGGTTPYVHGALKEARDRGAKTVFIACVPADQVKAAVDVDIRLLVGPEVLAGSTRLKAGTATKLALNILSTGTMVKLGKVYGNRMVDVSVTNSKLYDRAIRIITDLTGLERPAVAELLAKSDRRVKLALLMYWANVDAAEGDRLLQAHHGQLRQALQAVRA